MAQTELSKRIKVLNERYKDVVKAFGYSSKEANKWRSIMAQGATATTKSGNLALRNVKNQNVKVIEKLEKQLTAGESKQYLFEKGLVYFGGAHGKTRNQIIGEYKEITDSIHDLVDRYKDYIYNLDASLTVALRRGWDKPLNSKEVQKLMKVVKMVDDNELTNKKKWDTYQKSHAKSIKRTKSKIADMMLEDLE